MLRCVFKEEKILTFSEKRELGELLLPLFSWSYHFSQSYKNNGTLYFSSKPMWRLFLYEGENVIGSLSIVQRKLRYPFPIIIGGIGNFGIKESYQNQGLSSLMLREAHRFMKGKGINISLLFCIDRLKEVYKKAGYKQTEKPVTYYSKGQLREEPISLFFQLSIDSKQANYIQQNGFHIGRGSW